MKVKCINDKNLIEPVNGTLLTFGKEYEIIRFQSEDSMRIYWLKDDTGELRFYDSKRFSPTIEDLRDEKINQILNSEIKANPRNYLNFVDSL